MEIAHQLLKLHLCKDDVIIDATVGNGHDTVFLAPFVKHVYAFDIQKEAIDHTIIKLDDLNITNVTLIHDSHQHYHQYVNDFKAAIFNLGYLPKGDKSITTQADITLSTVTSMLRQLPIGGFIQIVVYTGHEHGQLESESLHELFRTLSNIQYQVMKIDLPFQDNHPPYIFMVYKKKDEA